jgi:1-acylglycerone phosphate reductase
MATRVAFITGSSKGGIGYELCRAFTSEGFKVFATARNLQKLDGLPDSVGRVQMDVMDGPSVEKAVKVHSIDEFE